MKQIQVIFLALIALMLISCVGSSDSSSSGGAPTQAATANKLLNALKINNAVPNVPTSLGELPNGSQIIIAQPYFVEQPDASFTTSIFLTDATNESDNTTYKLSFATKPIIDSTHKLSVFQNHQFPTVTAQDCNIAADGNCTINVDTNNAPLGNYYITPIFTNSQTGEISYGSPVSYSVTSSSQAQDNNKGQLVIMVNSTDIPQIGQSISGFVGLTGSKGVESLTVEIQSTNSDESNIASVKPESCVITSTTGCPITITGLEAGATSFTVTAVGSSNYRPATTPIIQVHAPIVPGHLKLVITPDSLSYNGYASAKVTLESAVNVNNLAVSMVSTESGIASFDADGCIISNSTNKNSCSMALKAGVITGYTIITAYVDNNTYTPASKIASVHPYPTYGHLQVTLKDPEIAYGQKTQALVTLVNSSYVESFVVSENSSNPSIATIDAPGSCTLSSNHNTCAISVTAGNESGIVNLTASAISYEPVQNSLNVYPTPIPGSLSITLSKATIAKDGMTVATIALNNSQYVKDAMVTIASDATDIATINGDNTCHLSSVESNTCHIQIKGVAVGSTNITAISNRYTPVKTPIAVITPGTLTMSPNTINMVYGAQSTITLSLNGSIGVNNASVQLTSGDTNVAAVTSCNPATIGSTSTICTATITAGQITGNTTITATVNANSYTYSSVATTVNVTPNILPGTLAISPTSITMPKSSQATAMISLVNSQLVTTPIPVNVSSQNGGIASVDRTLCSLTTAKPSCQIQVYGVNMGQTTVLATSNGYDTPQAPVTVTKPNNIPQQCSTAQNGGFSTPMPFNGVNVSYTFTPNHFDPAPYGAHGYKDVLFVADSANISPGQKIITDASSTNPVTVGAVTRMPAWLPSSGEQKSEACGGAWANATFSINLNNMNLNDIDRGVINLDVNNTNNSACGYNTGKDIWIDVPMSGFTQTQTLYENDQGGCGTGGDKWDIGARTQINGSGCIGDTCSYNIIVTAWHGGIGSQCHDTQTKVYQFNIPKPKVSKQLANLGNFNLQSTRPSFVGYGNQGLNVSIGGVGVPTSQTITCPAGTNSCTSSTPKDVWYNNNWLNSTTMNYNLTDLVSGDSLKQVCVNFNAN